VRHHLAYYRLRINPLAPEQPGRHGLGHCRNGEQDVLGPNLIVLKECRLFPRQLQYLAAHL